MNIRATDLNRFLKLRYFNHDLMSSRIDRFQFEQHEIFRVYCCTVVRTAKPKKE
jgi:hypothetical protein